MRRWGLILFACLLAGCGTNPAAPAAREADDTRAWQGIWKLVSCVENGQSVSGNVEWVVKGDRYTITVDGKPHTDPYKFKLDPKQKRIDVFHHDTPKGTYGGQLKGIYDIQGDSLKVCYDLKGQRFPKSFDAGRGSGQVVYQFRRK
jgi:uncharacterized protein (TIGR03067 family)